MPERNPLPEIPEFMTWRDEDGWHAIWERPLTLYETEADLPDQADAASFARLVTTCDFLRIRRDVINRPLYQVWRREDLAARFTTGDPP